MKFCVDNAMKFLKEHPELAKFVRDFDGDMFSPDPRI